MRNFEEKNFYLKEQVDILLIIFKYRSHEYLKTDNWPHKGVGGGSE